MVNEVLVAKGYATLATYPPDIAAVDRIRAAQPADARGGAGLWSATNKRGVVLDRQPRG